MLDRGIEPNVVIFGALINACAKASNLQRAEYWHHRMLEMNVTPNVRSYSAVINACAKAGKASEAVGWLERLEDAGLQSDTRWWFQTFVYFHPENWGRFPKF